MVLVHGQTALQAHASSPTHQLAKDEQTMLEIFYERANWQAIRQSNKRGIWQLGQELNKLLKLLAMQMGSFEFCPATNFCNNTQIAPILAKCQPLLIKVWPQQKMLICTGLMIAETNGYLLRAK